MKNITKSLFSGLFALGIVFSLGSTAFALGPSDPTEDAITAAGSSQVEITNEGHFIFHRDSTKAVVGDIHKVYLASTPTQIGTTQTVSDFSATVTNDVVTSLHYTGNHTLALTDQAGNVLEKAPVVFNADGTVNVEATRAAIEAIAPTSSKDFNPVVPAGLAIIVVALAGGVVIARKKAATSTK